MRAIVQRRYGSADDLELGDVPEPVAGRGEVLVRVHAASMHADVWHMVAGRPYAMRLMGGGLRRPRCQVPGIDAAGVVEAVGAGVTRFAVGARVYGETQRGHQWHNGGAFAELVVAPEDAIVPMPDGLGFVEAASLASSGLIALQAMVDELDVQPGQRVLVNGAGGGVGVFLVQVAVARGAIVTAVDRAAKLDALRALGATDVIDFEHDDFTRTDRRWDTIVDVPVNHRWSRVREALEPDGRYVMIGHDAYGAKGAWFGTMGTFFFRLLPHRIRDRRIGGFAKVRPRRERLEELSALVEAGAVRPVVDRTFPLEQAADALRYLTSEAPIGKVVLEVR